MSGVAAQKNCSAVSEVFAGADALRHAVALMSAEGAQDSAVQRSGLRVAVGALQLSAQDEGRPAGGAGAGPQPPKEAKTDAVPRKLTSALL